MSNMLLRALSGSVYVALIVLACIFSRLGFDLLMLVFAVTGIYEFHNITAGREASMSTRFGILSLDILAVMSTLLLSMALFLGYPLTSIAALDSMMVFAAMAGVLLVIYAVSRVGFALFQRSGNPVRMLASSLLGVTYLSVGLCSAVVLDSLSNGLVLITFIFIWLNDTGAYLTGRALGRHKLCVHLSPKKTWEGFFGGMAFCVAAGVLFSVTGFGRTLMPVYPALSTLGMLGFALPLAAVVFSTAGDLFESMVKRNAGVKDSGRIIPGHGGILDRIDSMLFAMPGVAIIVLIVTMFPF